MKSLGVLLCALCLAGCSPSDDDIRRLIRDEMQRQPAAVYFSSAKVIGPYTPAVQTGPLVFVSGQIALDPETGQMVQTDFEAETRQVLKNLRAVLASAGCDSSDVVSATVYLKNLNDYQRLNAVYGAFFPEGRYPARVAVEVSNLPKSANIEIAVVAVKK
jgi:2-iminobutanoate/2-iminopropanoate deaminase